MLSGSKTIRTQYMSSEIRYIEFTLDSDSIMPLITAFITCTDRYLHVGKYLLTFSDLNIFLCDHINISINLTVL